jgi:hypothetical protein
VLDFDPHSFEFKDIGIVKYRLLPKIPEELGRVFIELSYKGEETVTRGTVMRLHDFIDYHLFEEHEDRWIGSCFSKKEPTVFFHRLSNYEWDDDYFLSCKIDDRRIYMDDNDFRRETFWFADIGDITYRVLPKNKDANDVVVQLSWLEEEPALWDSIHRLYDIMDNDIF